MLYRFPLILATHFFKENVMCCTKCVCENHSTHTLDQAESLSVVSGLSVKQVHIVDVVHVVYAVYVVYVVDVASQIRC